MRGLGSCLASVARPLLFFGRISQVVRMRKWKTILWIVVLSFLSVSCGSRDDSTGQVGTGVGTGTGLGTGLGTGTGSGGYWPPGGGGGSWPPAGGGTGGTVGGSGVPVLYASDGVYLGTVVPASADVESICYPAGEFGSTTSPTSIWNPWGAYGSPSSPLSANNPISLRPPTICYWDGVNVTNCFAFLSKNRSLGYTTYDPDQIRMSLCRY